uniref:Uncharacterized protein n=1 Tax=Lepeophtheirus salmonis TaxID=72036 RepID=A0A0K2TG93_LEPSM
MQITAKYNMNYRHTY